MPTIETTYPLRYAYPIHPAIFRVSLERIVLCRYHTVNYMAYSLSLSAAVARTAKETAKFPNLAHLPTETFFRFGSTNV